MKNARAIGRNTLLVLWSIVCLFPIYWLLIASFKSANDQFDGPYFLPFLDFQPTLEAWNFILAEPTTNILFSAFNSFVIAFCATLISVIFGAFVIYGVTRFPIKPGRNNSALNKLGGENLLFLLLIARIMPPIVIVLPLYFMAQFTVTLDTVFFLIFVYAAINLPVAIWLLRPVLGNKASEMEESALLEGASHLRVVFEFVVPVSAAAFASVSIIIFILCWNEYLFAAFLATDNAITLSPWATGQLSMQEAQIGGEAEEWAHMAAATVFMMLPVLALLLLSRGFLSRIRFLQR